MTVSSLKTTATGNLNNNNNNESDSTNTTKKSIDGQNIKSVVRMGRRKQNCPQKTGVSSNADDGNDENGLTDVKDAADDDKGGSDSASITSGTSDRDVTLPTLEPLEPESNGSVHKTMMQDLLHSSSELGLLKSNPLFKFGQSSGMSPPQSSADDPLGILKSLPMMGKPSPTGSGDLEALNMLKNNPLFNPALLSLNPSLYAVQLAQLQAAQLLSHSGIQQLGSGAEESRKRKMSSSDDGPQVGGVGGALNLSKKSPESSPRRERGSAESPLDLSGSKRSLGSLLDGCTTPKLPKLEDNSKYPFSWAAASALPFLSPLFGNLSPEALARIPGLGSLVSASGGFPGSSSSPPPQLTSPSMMRSNNDGGKNPLERMSEIAKTGGGVGSRPNLGGRHSAWQSQWINRGPETNKDVFKCVWCKESFTSLNALTVHMKETKHFGGAVPPTSPISPQVRPPSCSPQKPPLTPPSSMPTPQMPPQLHGGPTSHKQSRDILKEHLPLPRKLVRGQDVWLGRGEQQTKDILKCMWCGESFRSLDLMTKHMQETKHYTKVISQEQLMSWKAPETGGGAQNHVNAVLTCKVCEHGFSSLKELSDHMVKNNHFNKESGPSARPPPSGAVSPAGVGSAAGPSPGLGLSPSSTNQQQSKEKRKKSLPVRKLLELERAQQELSGHLKGDDLDVQPGKISCERCGDKIPMLVFVDHIRQCVGPSLTSRSLGNSGMQRPPSSSPGDFASLNRMMSTSSVSPPMSTPLKSTTPSLHDKKSPGASSQAAEVGAVGAVGEEPKSILGSLERMVQNNFGAKKKNAGPDTNMSILQRLGIDEGVDYTKPLMDPASALFRPHGLGMFMGSSSRPSASSRSNSSECSSPDRFKCERSSSNKSESSVRSPHPADEVPLPPTLIRRSPAVAKFEDGALSVKKELAVDDENSLDVDDDSVDDDKALRLGIKPDLEMKKEIHEDEDLKVCALSPASQHSHNGKSEIEVDDKDDDSKPGDLSDNGEGEVEPSKKSHPLAALQLLCDKTEKKSVNSNKTQSHGQINHGMATGAALYGGPSVDPGAILAFSWACNQAVVNDSLLKCPFCDTPFISKGAYRHHLSKMHFVKDAGTNGTEVSGKGFLKTPEKSPGISSNSQSDNVSSVGAGSVKEENAQSKFQKYSQLAKQLSCSSQQ